MRTTLCTAIIAALASAPLFAGDMNADANGDELVTRDEFNTHVEGNGIFADFDANGDGYIDREEFESIDFVVATPDQFDFDEWDADEDTRLSAQEYGEGIFDTFDENEDGHWDGDEWDDAGEAGLWDV